MEKASLREDVLDGIGMKSQAIHLHEPNALLNDTEI